MSAKIAAECMPAKLAYIYIYRNVTQVHASENRS